jgi:hypothetical protein
MKQRYTFDHLFEAGSITRQFFTIEQIESMAKREDEEDGNDTINYFLRKK